MMRILLFIALFSSSFAVFSQTPITLQSDRPGIGYNANTVGKGVVLHQVGYQWSRSNVLYWYIDNHDMTSNVRVGILKDLEVHWNFNYNFSKTATDLPASDPRRQFFTDESNHGVSLTSFGARYRFLSGTGWKPTMAVMVDFETPLVSLDYRGNTPTGNALLISNWNYESGLFWGITTGVTQIGRSNTIPYAINFGSGIGSRWSVFIEYYGSFSRYESFGTPYNVLTNGFDGGLTFLAHSNIVLDASAGWQNINDEGNAGIRDSFFVSAGLTWAIQAWSKSK